MHHGVTHEIPHGCVGFFFSRWVLLGKIKATFAKQSTYPRHIITEHLIGPDNRSCRVDSSWVVVEVMLRSTTPQRHALNQHPKSPPFTPRASVIPLAFSVEPPVPSERLRDDSKGRSSVVAPILQRQITQLISVWGSARTRFTSEANQPFVSWSGEEM